MLSLFLRHLNHRKSKMNRKSDDDGRGLRRTDDPSDPKQQPIQAAGAKAFPGEEPQDTWRNDVFCKVRILVIGRSGVGKTTLIRLMIGKEGPQNISEDVGGVQDINKEFQYSSEEDGVPLVIHDSNGMGVRGKRCVDEIRDFLKRHQNTKDFSEQVHVIWYVISAIDPRFVDDGDMMKMIGEFNIPLLLIMTHCDYEKTKISDASLNKLLEGYRNEEDREAVKKMMVKVANDGVMLGLNNKLIVDERKRDKEGLREVAKRTQKLMDKRLRYTWIAAQAVDIDGKVHASAKLIAIYMRKVMLMSLPQGIADPLQLTVILYRVLVIMSMIWVVPTELREALGETLVMNEGGCQMLEMGDKDVLYAVKLAMAVGALNLATSDALVLPRVASVLYMHGVQMNARMAVPILVKTFSLQVLGAILYVKSRQVVISTEQSELMAVQSKEEYVRMCEDFASSDDYQSMLDRFIMEDCSKLDIAMRQYKVKGIIKREILEMYSQILLHDCPDSLFTIKMPPLQDDDHDDHSSEAASMAFDISSPRGIDSK